jgi:hypothetical protein
MILNVNSLRLDQPPRVAPSANSLRCGRPLSLPQRQERRSHIDDTSPSKPPGDRVQLHPVRHTECIESLLDSADAAGTLESALGAKRYMRSRTDGRLSNRSPQSRSRHVDALNVAVICCQIFIRREPCQPFLPSIEIAPSRFAGFVRFASSNRRCN